MNVLVIGVDNTGKTTLVESLRKKLSWPVFNFTKQLDNNAAIETCRRGIFAAEQFENILFDRFPHPDDFVYTQAMSGKSIAKTLMAMHTDWIMPLMLRGNFRIIYCEATFDDMKKRLIEIGDEHINADHLRSLVDNYELYLKETPLPYIRLNSSELTKEEMVEQSMRFIRGR